MENKKTILFLINKFKRGGAERQFTLQINKLHQRGYSVYLGIVYKFVSKDSFLEDLEILEEKIKNFDFSSAFDKDGLERVEKFIQDKKVEVVYSTLEDANIVTRLLKKRNKDLRAITRESGMANRKSLQNKLLDIYLNIWTDKIVAVSDNVRRSLMRYQPMWRKKIVVIENGTIERSEEYVKDMKARYYDPNRFTILNIGLMRSLNKGQDGILRAFKAVVEAGKIKNPYLILVGEGQMRETHEKYVADNGLRDKVEFKDRMNSEEIEKLYARADLYIQNSKSEGNPNTVLEAHSFGISVIDYRGGSDEGLVEAVRGEVRNLEIKFKKDMSINNAVDELVKIL